MKKLLALLVMIPFQANAYNWAFCQHVPDWSDVVMENVNVWNDCAYLTQYSSEWNSCLYSGYHSAVSELYNVAAAINGNIQGGWFFYMIQGGCTNNYPYSELPDLLQVITGYYNAEKDLRDSYTP